MIMYRLISQRYSCILQTHAIATQTFLESRFRTCCYCQQMLLRLPGSSGSSMKSQYLHSSQIQYYSTITSSVSAWPTSKTKKIKRNRKKYADLLEVTQDRSSEKRTKISKLKATELSMLIDDASVLDIPVSSAEATELLSEMGDTSEARLMQEDHDQELLDDTVPELEGVDVVPEVEGVDADIPGTTNLITKASKKHPHSKFNALYEMYQKMEQEGKSESLARSLTAYLDLCGHLGKVSELMEAIKADNIKPNTATFISCFECVGRHVENTKNHEKLKAWAAMMNAQDVSMNTLFQEGNFSGNCQEMVLKACRRLQPDFVPKIQSPDSSYTCDLLQELNSPPLELAAEQLNIELKGIVTVRSIEKVTQSAQMTSYYREVLAAAQENWREVVTEAFQRNLETLKVQHQGYRGMREISLYPFLIVLPQQQYIDIIMQEIRKLAEGSETFSPTLQLLYRDIGTRVLIRYQVQSKLQTGVVQKIQSIFHDYCEWLSHDGSQGCENMRSKWQKLLEGTASGPLWGRFVKEEIKPHPILSKLFRGAALEELTFDVEKVPMLCPPLPWSNIKLGGHLISNTDIIRLPLQAAQQWQRLVDAPSSQMYPVLDALNQLSSVPWKINDTMLDVVTEVFNSGGSHKLDIPEPPSACPVVDKITADMTKAEKIQAHRKRLMLRRKKAEMYSLWCDTLYHMARSLLCFAKGEPLGKDGLNWLKVHIVNLTGLLKKESVEKRLKYAENIMPQILDSADNPLGSEEPWQTLACCMEVANASRSPNPEEYVCNFPIHQDGSCNGLQHYAALGRDEAGAVSVNLAPAPIPQDVYSCIAVLVEREREKDAAAGVKIAQVLDGFVRRKVIKQTVMTTVYGVTRFGARLQIARQLKDIDAFPKDFVWQASTYLVGKTFDSLREMFTSTKEIQDWFTESARLISQVRGKNVERPNVMKQKNAFPPNFIHSLDSSHMMLTSLFCERQGITFVSVHDCYWTHPSTVDIMNEVCREQFVALHQQPILEDLSKFLVDKFSFPEIKRCDKLSAINAARAKLNKVLTQVPRRGTFDLSQVLESVYFFS
ncbi:hypothetical protein B566_EDAN012892 [Ephemera danica]|nr:hypothetical protein B566_EDAN012892 [Ephemera danica]